VTLARVGVDLTACWRQRIGMVTVALGLTRHMLRSAGERRLVLFASRERPDGFEQADAEFVLSPYRHEVLNKLVWLPPAEVIAAYRDHGYDFLAITDHFLERYHYPVTDTRAFQTDSFTTLLGAELHGPQTEVGERWHIVGVGLPLDFAPLQPGETGPQIAARAAAAGAFIGMAHPAWYTLTLNDALSLEAADAVEGFVDDKVEMKWHGEEDVVEGSSAKVVGGLLRQRRRI